MSVQLALRKHDKRLSARAIHWWTGSFYSHCELVVDGYCYSSSVMDKGVRRKRIELKPNKWDLIELPWASGEDVQHYFAQTDHYRYGWPSLITSQLFNLNKAGKGAQFCSEWCAAAIGMPNPSSYSPGSLGAVCGWVNKLPVLQSPARE
mgnify:CR=1 FL=1|tara:strand:+ start:1140 stop:1586 length:447 start_codon:yes stop_codon:yes gene_type:complete